jgi:hypothetical protein
MTVLLVYDGVNRISRGCSLLQHVKSDYLAALFGIPFCPEILKLPGSSVVCCVRVFVHLVFAFSRFFNLAKLLVRQVRRIELNLRVT